MTIKAYQPVIKLSPKVYKLLQRAILKRKMKGERVTIKGYVENLIARSLNARQY